MMIVTALATRISNYSLSLGTILLILSLVAIVSLYHFHRKRVAALETKAAGGDTEQQVFQCTTVTNISVYIVLTGMFLSLASTLL